MISPFPKIFAIGTTYILDIFKHEVEVTEKLDGSQLSFGKINDTLYIRSKGAQLFIENPEKMFSEGISYIDSIQNRLPNNYVFYSEYMKKPKHNTLKYNRIPKNHLMLFGIMDIHQQFHNDRLDEFADLFEIDSVPILFRGKINHAGELMSFLERESYLEGCNIEGVVVKNFENKFLLGGQPIPLMAGKLVSEGFKEVHRERWGNEEKTKSRLEVFYDSFRTEARWEKAIQHLRDKGELLEDPKDIGNLIKEIHRDIESEEKENIKEFLYREFIGEIKRKSVANFPYWYKEYLLNKSFGE